MSNTNIEPITLERILDKGNLRNAFKKVINNKGSAGVDEMETRDLKDYFLVLIPTEFDKKIAHQFVISA